MDGMGPTFHDNMKLGPGEPSAAPWRVIAFSDFVRRVFDVDRKPRDRPWIVAVDGRGGGGKSTLAGVLHRFVPSSAVVHTDDVAWHHSFFNWSDLLIEGILKPLHNGNAVRYQPPGWHKKGRSGAIGVAADLDLVIEIGRASCRERV